MSLHISKFSFDLFYQTNKGEKLLERERRYYNFGLSAPISVSSPVFTLMPVSLHFYVDFLQLYLSSKLQLGSQV